jgi:copper resistance protein D
MDPLSSLLVVSRALHFAAALLIWGGLVLALVVVDPAAQTSQPIAVDVNERVRGFLRTAGRWGLGVSLLSGIAWLFLEAALMSGQPIAEATRGDTLWLVLTGTGFGRVWMWRFAIAATLGALMFAQAAAVRDRSSSKGTWLPLALAGGYLASLALVGHAADGQGAERFLRITTDAVHLLAAGAWLGALPGLAILLASALRAPSAASLGLAARAARRFSRLGIASVGALLATGLVNAWYLVGDVPALLGTPYGRLLVAKILLFATMVALAATNRRRLTPQVQDRDASALRTLTRNATLEIVAGSAVVAIVGALGVAIPAVHQSPVWPFRLTLNLEPAYPTSYARSPVGYTTATIARGSAAYAANCVQCHGLHGRGDGPSAATLPIRPVDLVEHAAHHRPGDLFWRIARGIPQTPMPAFSPRLSDEELWTLVQYLRALSESQMAQALTTRVQPLLPIAAPDFAFEESPRVQETLANLHGDEVLLVAGVLPESLPRLQQIETQRTDLATAGIRVILMVADGGTLPQRARAIPDAPRLAIADSDTTQTYAMFACATATACASSIPSHVEWLIDREGHLRARWLGVSGTGVDRTAEIIADTRQLQREPSSLPARHDHGH